MAEAEFEVGGQKYRAVRMGVMVQFHLARKLAPVMIPVAEAAARGLAEPRKDKKAKVGDGLDAGSLARLSGDQIALLAGPVLEALGRMTDEEADDIVFPCLAVVQRFQAPGWQPVLATGARALMFDDITLQVMLQLVWKVLEANLAGFFQDVPSSSTEAPA